jgi:hypothetical protein
VAGDWDNGNVNRHEQVYFLNGRPRGVFRFTEVWVA